MYGSFCNLKPGQSRSWSHSTDLLCSLLVLLESRRLQRPASLQKLCVCLFGLILISSDVM